MNTEAEKSKLHRFIGTLAIVALVINACFMEMTKRSQISRQQEQAAIQQQQQQRAQDTQAQQQARLEQQKEKQEQERQRQIAAEEHARYLARYLNPGSERKSGIESVAVAVATEKGVFNQALTRALAIHLKTNSIETLPGFFKPQFVSDGLINDGFSDVCTLGSNLELTNYLDAILVARQTVSYSANPSLENVLTATMNLEITALTIGGDIKRQSWTFTAAGAGFNEANARAMAEERISRQISTATNLSLGLVLP